MIVTIKRYIANLKYEEQFKPEGQRRDVPIVADLTDATGKTRQQMYNIINNEAGMIKRLDFANIIKLFRARGFSTDVADLLEYRDQ